MKKLIFLFLLISCYSFGQSKIETIKYTDIKLKYKSIDSKEESKISTILFNKINEYRISKGLKPLQYDTIAVKESKHHSEYVRILVDKSGRISHYEDSTKFSTPDNRYKFYGGYKYKSTCEVIAFGGCNAKETDSLKYEKLAKTILELWKNSAPHNKILLKTDVYFGGGYINIRVMEQGIKGIKHYEMVATFCLVDDGVIKVVE